MIKSSVDKDSEYRNRLLEAINADHPIYNGIDMQAHHVISAKGVILSGLKKKLTVLDYHINNIENLVFIPCTLDGACHLEVQLHRGNHTFSDDDHPRSYHEDVSDRLKRLEEKMDKRCSEGKKVQSLIDKESIKVLSAINDFELPLTKLFKYFKPDPEQKIGCANAHSIPSHSGDLCKSNRHHFDNVDKPYTLEIGK
jgi:hypothetical protein